MVASPRHVWCEWIGERGTARFVGGTHHVHEYIGGELQKHCREEMSYLAGFLPDLYARETSLVT